MIGVINEYLRGRMGFFDQRFDALHRYARIIKSEMCNRRAFRGFVSIDCGNEATIIATGGGEVIADSGNGPCDRAAIAIARDEHWPCAFQRIYADLRIIERLYERVQLARQF